MLSLKCLAVAAAAIIVAGAAQAATVGQFIGTVDVSSVFGTPTETLSSAVLDDGGTLTLEWNAIDLTPGFESDSTLQQVFSGSLAGSTLTISSAASTTVSCTNLLGSSACSFIAVGIPNPMNSLPASVVFDLTPDAFTVFTAGELLSGFQVDYQYNLEAVPEPGTAVLLGLGLSALGLKARRRS